MPKYAYMPDFEGFVSRHEGLDSNGEYICAAADISGIEVEAWDEHVFINVRFHNYYDGNLSSYCSRASLLIDPDATLYALTRRLFAHDPRRNEQSDNVCDEFTYVQDGAKYLARHLATHAIPAYGMDYKAMDYFVTWGFVED